jgi:hypothetical protein
MMKKQRKNKIISQVKKDRAARRTAAKEAGTPEYRPSVVHRTSKKDVFSEIPLNVPAEEILEIMGDCCQDEYADVLAWYGEDDEPENIYDDLY